MIKIEIKMNIQNKKINDNNNDINIMQINMEI